MIPVLSTAPSVSVRPGDLATVVYTSGTSGPPRGAMLIHSNIMSVLRNVTPVYDIGEGDRLLSFLPLSHIAERMMSDFLPIAVAGETWFARNIATVAEDLPACRPTVFLAVPRLWEKLRETIESNGAGPERSRCELSRSAISISACERSPSNRKAPRQ